MRAVPILAFSFSATGKGAMAPVGHTAPQKLQLGSHGPRRGVTTGLNAAAKPTAVAGQTSTQTRQAMHMIRHQMAFFNLVFFLPYQIPKHPAQMLSKIPVY